jgi:phage tail sheath gpL-like
MLKYHRLIIPEQNDDFAKPLDSTELKLMSKKMKEDIDKAESNSVIHKSLITLRVMSI